LEAGAIEIMDTAAGCRFRVRVKPGARADLLLGAHGGALKLSVSAPAEMGKANAAVISLLAATLDRPRSAITITAGHASRDKTVLVTGARAEQVRARLAAH
jgi:uncharacterized protein